MDSLNPASTDNTTARVVRLSRRRLLRVGMFTLAAVPLAVACSPSPPATKPAETKPADAAKPAEAAKAYAAASAAKPDNANSSMAAGVALQETKQWDAAFALFEGWVKREPKAAMAWYQVGRTSALSGQRLDVGAAALKTFMGLPSAPNLPTVANAQYRLGQVQAHAGPADQQRGADRGHEGAAGGCDRW